MRPSSVHRMPVSSTPFASLALSTASLCALLLAAGCSNVTSQNMNAEGVQLYQQGNYQQASDRFQQAITQDQNAPQGYYNLAAALHKTGTLYNRPSDLQQAELLYNQCLERDPNNVDCHRGLAVLLKDTNRSDSAFRLLEGWAGRTPDAASPKIELARLLEESGRAEDAKLRLVEALVNEPHNPRALTALGRLRDQSGDHLQALSNYQRSLAVNSNQPQIASRVATLQATVGRAATTTAGVPAQVPYPGANDPRYANPWQSSTRY